MFYFNLLQFIGGIIISVGYLPQIIQIIKTKSANDLNVVTLFSVFIGIFLMEIYAIALVTHGSGAAFLITNTLALALSADMLVLTVAYKK